MSKNVFANLNETDYEELQKLALELDYELRDLVKQFVIFGLYHIDDLPSVLNNCRKYRWHKH